MSLSRNGDLVRMNRLATQLEAADISKDGFSNDEESSGISVSLASPSARYSYDSNARIADTPSTCTSSTPGLATKGDPRRHQEPLHTERQSNGQNRQNPGPDCRCLNSMVEVIEEIEIQKQKASNMNLDVSLCVQGRALDRCDALLDCVYCSNASHSLMLLIVLYEKLLTPRPIWSQEMPSDHGQRVPEDGAEGDEPAAVSPVLYGRYEISSSRERVQVGQILQVCFKERSIKLLGRIEEHTRSKGWDTQLKMIKRLRNCTLNPY